MNQIQHRIEIQPKAFDYQRNGISGIPFFTMAFDWKDSENESGVNFIATFETDEEDQSVKYETCRIVDPSNPLKGWRGDMFGMSINEVLKSMQKQYVLPYISDLQSVINGVVSY